MDYGTDDAGRKRIGLDYDRRLIGGVCAGCASYFDVDPAWVRVGAVVTALFFTKIVIAAYVIGWLVLDRHGPRRNPVSR